MDYTGIEYPLKIDIRYNTQIIINAKHVSMYSMRTLLRTFTSNVTNAAA